MLWPGRLTGIGRYSGSQCYLLEPCRLEFSGKIKKLKMLQPKPLKAMFVRGWGGSPFKGFHVGVLRGHVGNLWTRVSCARALGWGGGVLVGFGGVSSMRVWCTEDVLLLAFNCAVLNACFVGFLFHFRAQ